jgi:hypothetical protein
VGLLVGVLTCTGTSIAHEPTIAEYSTSIRAGRGVIDELHAA